MPYGEGYDAPQQPSDGAMGYGGQGSYEDCPKGEYGASMSQNENGQPQEPPKGPPWYRQGPGSQAIPQDQWNNLDSGGQAGTMGHDTGAQSYDQQGDIPPPPWYQQGPGSQAIPKQAWTIIDSEPVTDDPEVTGGPGVTGDPEANRGISGERCDLLHPSKRVHKVRHLLPEFRNSAPHLPKVDNLGGWPPTKQLRQVTPESDIEELCLIHLR